MLNLDNTIIQALRAATRVVVFTGAGVSAESGIPTFRDKQTGLWENFDAAELATPDAFERDPALVWGWYEWRRGLVLSARYRARVTRVFETSVTRQPALVKSIRPRAPSRCRTYRLNARNTLHRKAVGYT